MTKKRLVLTDGVRERELQLAGRIVVGRDPSCEISHDDSLLSRRHAEFLTTGDKVMLRDLGSRNGVFVNGERAMERVLEPGDVIQIGPLRARFVLDDAPTSVIAEAVDADRTAVIRKVFTSAQIDAAGKFAGVATAESDADEVTRLVPAPRLSTAGEPVEQPYVRYSTPADDEVATVHIRPAERARTEIAPAPRADAGLFHSILTPVLLLSLLVAGTAVLPVLMGMPTSWMALPIVLALAGSYAVSLSINRRVSDTLASFDRERT
jgi:predicted component of type VI protein secretion system